MGQHTECWVVGIEAQAGNEGAFAIRTSGECEHAWVLGSCEPEVDQSTLTSSVEGIRVKQTDIEHSNTVDT